MEGRIVAKLSVQLSADRAIIDRHDLNRLLTLESTCTALSRENEALKLKTDHSDKTEI